MNYMNLIPIKILFLYSFFAPALHAEVEEQPVICVCVVRCYSPSQSWNDRLDVKFEGMRGQCREYFKWEMATQNCRAWAADSTQQGWGVGTGAMPCKEDSSLLPLINEIDSSASKKSH